MIQFRIYGNNGQAIITLPYSAIFPIDITSMFTQYHLDYNTTSLKLEMALKCYGSGSIKMKTIIGMLLSHRIAVHIKSVSGYKPFRTGPGT